VLFAILLSTASPVCADLAAPEPRLALESADGLTITCIDYAIDGAVRASAVQRALRLGVGSTFSAEVWRRDLQTLQNLGLFRRFDTEVLEVASGGVALRLHVHTAFSLLPYLGYEGGAVPTFMLGGYYGNLFGEMLDAGGYYMRRGPYNLGRLWLTMPHLLAPSSVAEVQLLMTAELRPRFPGPAGWRVPESGVEVLKRGGFADVGWQPVPDLLTVSLRYAFFVETSVPVTNLPAVAQTELDGSASPEVERGDATTAHLSLVALTLLLGQIDLVDNFLHAGDELRAVLVGSHHGIGSDRDFAWLYLAYRGFRQILPDVEAGVRVAGAHATSDDPRDDLLLGGYNLEPFVYNCRRPGLLNVRGLRHGQMHGRNLAFANLELRYTMLRGLEVPLAGDISLQLAAFGDAGSAWTGRQTDDLAVVAGGGALLTLLDFRYTYVNWYVARVFQPFAYNTFNVIVTRPFL
jgi:hypothetical protein